MGFLTPAGSERGVTVSSPEEIEPTVIPIRRQDALGMEMTLSAEGTVTYPESLSSERPGAPSADAGQGSDESDEDQE